ncbi:hypothetical protein EU534_01265, partial [Candidatus Heimdallarchaeota archaeon]
MEISKQDIIKVVISVILLATAIGLTMGFAQGTVAGEEQEALHEATLHCFYDNGTNQYSKQINFTFELFNRTTYPETIEIYDLGDNLTLWLAYSPKVQIGYNKQLIIRASITDSLNNTVDPEPTIGNFSVEISSDIEDGLDLTLPASSLISDYRGQKWVTFSLRLPYKSNIVLSLLFAVGVLWVMETIPLVATSLMI